MNVKYSYFFNSSRIFLSSCNEKENYHSGKAWSGWAGGTSLFFLFTFPKAAVKNQGYLNEKYPCEFRDERLLPFNSKIQSSFCCWVLHTDVWTITILEFHCRPFLTPASPHLLHPVEFLASPRLCITAQFFSVSQSSFHLITY